MKDHLYRVVRSNARTKQNMEKNGVKAFVIDAKHSLEDNDDRIINGKLINLFSVPLANHSGRAPVSNKFVYLNVNYIPPQEHLGGKPAIAVNASVDNRTVGIHEIGIDEVEAQEYLDIFTKGIYNDPAAGLKRVIDEMPIHDASTNPESYKYALNEEQKESIKRFCWSLFSGRTKLSIDQGNMMISDIIRNNRRKVSDEATSSPEESSSTED
jgi:hypothetical protein